jgi:UDP-N-acetylglucosamine 1-carboxyvinyltransferase
LALGKAPGFLETELPRFRRSAAEGTVDKFVIEGGRPLRGSVGCAGSKNAVLPILAASLLTDEPVVVPNAPRVADVASMLDVLRDLGSRAERRADGSIEVASAGVPRARADWNHVPWARA